MMELVRHTDVSQHITRDVLRDDILACYSNGSSRGVMERDVVTGKDPYDTFNDTGKEHGMLVNGDEHVAARLGDVELGVGLLTCSMTNQTRLVHDVRNCFFGNQGTHIVDYDT